MITLFLSNSPVIIISDSLKQRDKMSSDMQASSIHIALQSPPHLNKAFWPMCTDELYLIAPSNA